uniref:Uncharacterized protein n=1 Tax=Noctiluca scintillans TaxID=2966 RepID=A0A7S1A3R7_NOCSC|mmetsp:Transcript_29913/g.79649  ORF Transcript_29913/g.79649 Transcript_29913/m.79649 type:complete len:410 (+) Transcript_29913:77-1306(+)
MVSFPRTLVSLLEEEPPHVPPQPSNISMTDFVYGAQALAVVQKEAMPGSLQLRVNFPVQFRVGMHIMVDPGGSNEERAIVSRHTATAIVLSESLQHRHEIKERVVHVPLAEEEDECLKTLVITHETSTIRDKVSETVDKEVACDFDKGAADWVQDHVEISDAWSESVIWDMDDPPTTGSSTTDDLVVHVQPGTDTGEPVAFRKANSEELQGAGWRINCVSLLLYLAPGWTTYSVHMRRTQRFAVFVTALAAAAFVQSLFFVTGDGCHHEPKPVVCEPSQSMVDLGEISYAFWGVVLSTPIVYLVFSMFNKAPCCEPTTTDQKERTMRKWSRSERSGWVIVCVFNLCVWLFIFRTLQFFSDAVIGRWITGCILSSFSAISGSPMIRALYFIRWVAFRLAQQGMKREGGVV